MGGMLTGDVVPGYVCGRLSGVTAGPTHIEPRDGNPGLWHDLKTPRPLKNTISIFNGYIYIKIII